MDLTKIDITKYSRYIIYIIATIAIGILYDKYKLYEQKDKQDESYDLVRKFLLNDQSLGNSNKPIIWIHTTYEINARYWKDFYSRNSKDLNQPYIYLAIKSIVDKCGKDANICLIDDNSFQKLIPNWTVDINMTAEPVKGKIRELALARLLYTYGGFLVPNSFICFQDLTTYYNILTSGDKMFVGELVDRNCTSTFVNFFPNSKFMGCKKECETMKEYFAYLETILSHDFTDESNFLGSSNKWINQKVKQGEINVIPALLLGAKDTSGEPVGVEKLISSSYLDLDNNALGLYVPRDELAKRNAFNWFVRMSPFQALGSDTNLGKYLLLANA
jgi:hypothetical protein